MQKVVEAIANLRSLDSIQHQTLMAEAISVSGISMSELAAKVVAAVDRLGLWNDFIEVVEFFEGNSISAQKAIVVIEEYLSEREG